MRITTSDPDEKVFAKESATRWVSVLIDWAVGARVSPSTMTGCPELELEHIQHDSRCVLDETNRNGDGTIKGEFLEVGADFQVIMDGYGVVGEAICFEGR